MRIAAVGNGRSVHVVARSSAAAALGHQVRLVTLGEVLPAPGVEVCTRPVPRGLTEAARATRGFLNDLRSFGPDLLHLHYAGGKLGSLALLSGLHPLAVTVMGGDVLPEQHPGGLLALERRATRRVVQEADLLLVKSEALRLALGNWGPIAARVETLRWGVDPSVFRRDPAGALTWRERLGLPPEARVILSPRLLDPRYNIHLIVHALPQILQRVPGARLLLTEYGEVPAYRARLGEEIASLGLEGAVRFLGQVPQAEMSGLYSLADVVVAVPGSDGLPQSLFEAMACQAPLVLGRLTAYQEVVTDGQHVLLADFAPSAIAAATLQVLENASLARTLAERALARVQEVALLPQEMQRLDAFYRGLLSVPRRRSRWLPRCADALSLLLRR